MPLLLNIPPVEYTYNDEDYPTQIEYEYQTVEIIYR